MASTNYTSLAPWKQFDGTNFPAANGWYYCLAKDSNDIYRIALYYYESAWPDNAEMRSFYGDEYVDYLKTVKPAGRFMMTDDKLSSINSSSIVAYCTTEETALVNGIVTDWFGGE